MNPLSGRSLSVVRPEIESVLDSATGIEWPVSQVLGHAYSGGPEQGARRVRHVARWSRARSQTSPAR